MQESLYQTADAGDSVRQWMQETLHQTADARDYQTADADRDSLSDRCRRCSGESIRQQMQKTHYQTADAGDSLSDSGCRRLSIRQMQEMHARDSLYQTADAGVSQTADQIRQMQDADRCRRLSIRQQMLETLCQTDDAGDSLYQTADAGETLYQTADAGDGSSPSDSGCRRQELLYQTASGCRRLSIRQRMQEISLSDSGCRIRQPMQETLYQTVSLSDSGCRRAVAGDTLSDSR